MAYVNTSFMFCCALLLSTFTTNAMGATTPVFAEYIGALFNGVKFTDVPINPNVEVHMILAFAIDYTTTPSVAPTDGKFGIFWDNGNLSPDAVQQFKASNPNVKVSVSLGGDSISGQPAQFTPTSVSSWVANAVSSMSSLISEYHLDGIDIDYEHFVGDDDTFAECIGQLITQLKGQGLISFASIAPFDNPDVQTHYQALWKKYSAVIDYVNVQFYAYDASTTVDQFIGHYNDQVANYPGGNVLVSFTSNPSGGGLRPPGFFTACQQLKDMQSLKGIFVFSADSTKASGAGFQDEMQAQALLAP